MFLHLAKYYPHLSSEFGIKLACLFTISAFITLSTGCATNGMSSEDEALALEKYVWPAPPEKPRIRYLGSLKSSDSVGGPRKLTFKERLLGKKEEERLALTKPYGVHSDAKGRIYVADTGISGLVVFDLDEKNMSYWGTSGPGALTKPTGVTSDSTGNVYVSDVVGSRIVVFDREGKFINAYGGKEILKSPVGLAYNNNTQKLYVVDSKNHQIFVFDSEGKVDFKIGERGGDLGQFNFPTNIAMDSEGRLFVADTMNFRVQILEQDGTPVKAFGKAGDGRGDFSRLKGISVDSEGHIYTVDAAFNNVQIFNQQGQLLLTLGRSGTEPGGFYLPAGAHVDSNNRLYVADQLNLRIQMFQYLIESESQ